MNSLIIVLGIVIVIILFYLYRYFFTKKSLATNIHLNENPADISSNLIQNPNSILYSFGTWVYVNNFSNATLMSYVISSNDANPLFKLQIGGVRDGESNKPTLRAIINGTGANGKNTITEIKITGNFPVQKWVYVVVSVDTTYIDCYLDGKLVISKPIQTQITNSPTSTPYITFRQPAGSSASPDIYLTKVFRWDYPLDPQTVWTEYSSGNGLPNRKQFSIGVFSKTDGATNSYDLYSE
jgi:hypothetical protein